MVQGLRFKVQSSKFKVLLILNYQTAQCWSDFTNYQCFVPVTNIILNVPDTITVGVGNLKNTCESLKMRKIMKKNRRTTIFKLFCAKK